MQADSKAHTPVTSLLCGRKFRPKLVVTLNWVVSFVTVTITLGGTSGEPVGFLFCFLCLVGFFVFCFLAFTNKGKGTQQDHLLVSFLVLDLGGRNKVLLIFLLGCIHPL